MLRKIQGLHHITSLAADARRNNRFFTETLGLRRVKTTVNFDVPHVYHLYYGNEAGTPGTVMTYFPFPGIARGIPGTGEAAVTEFSVPAGTIAAWEERLNARGVRGLAAEAAFGEARLRFEGPDGDAFALVETADDARTPWTGGDVSSDIAIRGFRGVRLRLREGGAMGDLLSFMGYREVGQEGALTCYALDGGNGADRVDLEIAPDLPEATQGAGSVHHVAFSVADRAAQRETRDALVSAGHRVTEVIDRDYFWAIYFRTPGGVLFEVATDEPGFDRDEEMAHLGEALKLPSQHAHLRAWLEERLPPIED
ncbi:VOC family protein [Limibaculum sp. M0105]|uniref:VOC family protein n=1 Tax=Thermohalobaculum xanthum TaxID=2753746 RepID=A0A8J7M7H3_9RHOB|nr:VOC family protein [Thermohalobaculum xanthum]MBK0399713.1 VOC family protein [Thermohalobaculum xanthum]